MTSSGPPASPHEAVPWDYGMLLTTVASRDDAVRIANLLIDEKLAACVQLLPIESFYVWDGKTQNENELLLLIKTRTALFEPAIARIKSAHPYTVPQIVGTQFLAAFPPYLTWIGAVTQGGPAPL
jgi:periplasmic divalent cation tolerance protein